MEQQLSEFEELVSVFEFVSCDKCTITFTAKEHFKVYIYKVDDDELAVL